MDFRRMPESVRPANGYSKSCKWKSEGIGGKATFLDRKAMNGFLHLSRNKPHTHFSHLQRRQPSMQINHIVNHGAAGG